jgi:alpha-galactosidase
MLKERLIMFSSFSRRAYYLTLLAAIFLGTIPWCSAQLPEAMATAHRWAAAKFLGEVTPNPAESYLLVYSHSGPVTKNGVQGHHFRIVDQDYSRGLHFSSDGKVRVVLAGPAKSFEAIVGVDSNDIGYYSNVGRGAVVASVDVGGKTPFRSEVLHEGMVGVPVKVDLDNATEFDLKVEDGGGGVVFGNHFDQADWADARVTLADGKTVWLGDLPAGPLRAPYAAEVPFSFRYGDRPSSYLLKMWELNRSSRRLDDNRTEHTLTYTDPRSGLVVRSVAVEYHDFPVVEWTLYFQNTGSAPTPILENIQALDTRFERGEDGEFILHHSKGSQATSTDFEPFADRLERKAEKRFAAAGGRPTNTDMCYFNIALPGEGTIVALGWPGQWAAQFTRDEGTGLQVRAGQELTHFKLLPGEEVRSPLVALVFWHGDWIDGQNVWRRWMVAHNLPRPGGQLPAPLLSTGTNGYTIEMQGANEQNEKEFMQQYFDRGWKFDYWWMDAGWYHFKDGWWNTGTWDPDPARFPHGFRPISDFAHAHGAKTLVWFEPERVTPGSWLWENHPEWLLGKDGGNRLLYLGNPEARQWLTDHIDQLLTEQGIDLYRQDFNFDPLEIWRANDAPDRQGITEIRHVTGYLAYWDELRRRHPDMLIDTCASGGRRDDLETLRRAVPLWRSDYGYDDPPAMQNLTYGLALWVPYFGTGIRSSNSYSFRSTMAMAMGAGPDPRSKNVDFPALGRLASQWRKVAPYYYGDYYPLTPYTTEDSAWVAWQFDRPATGDGIVQAFRRSPSPIEEVRFKLRGLDAAAQYSVSNLDAPGESQFSGRELEEQGLPVVIQNQPGAVIITYKQVKGFH